ncbi:hypothetical protein Franean1_0854 [Parafrankia sp. EAN1pec]|nr:hypothetical protein Franean1_0854 [Frankia sp. EAN1pec]
MIALAVAARSAVAVTTARHAGGTAGRRHPARRGTATSRSPSGHPHVMQYSEFSNTDDLNFFSRTQEHRRPQVPNGSAATHR